MFVNINYCWSISLNGNKLHGRKMCICAYVCVYKDSRDFTKPGYRGGFTKLDKASRSIANPLVQWGFVKILDMMVLHLALRGFA